MLNRFRSAIAVTAAVAAWPCLAAAQDAAVRYDIPASGEIRVVSDVTIREAGGQAYRHRLAPGSRSAAARVVDRAAGATLKHRVEGGVVLVQFPEALAARAERRLVVEERAERAKYVADRGDALEFRHTVPPGRIVVLLPPGYQVSEASAPAQVAIEDGRAKLGVINDSPGDLPLRVLARKSGTVTTSAPVAGAFRAEDERSIVYWLDDPTTHRISLALELFLTHPGQSHAYSVLRDEDSITNPVSLDVDRGRELPTRIVKGREANALGDAPAPFPDDANVLVADLGYKVPPGGNARVRLYQTATDADGYRLQPDGELRWDRFLARLRTRAVLPTGWVLTSVDQPAVISRDEQGRVVLDFVQTGGDSPKLTLTARRASSDATP